MIARENAPGILLLGSESGFCFYALKTLRELNLPVAEVFIAGGPRSGTEHPAMGGSIPLAQPGSRPRP